MVCSLLRVRCVHSSKAYSGFPTVRTLLRHPECKPGSAEREGGVHSHGLLEHSITARSSRGTMSGRATRAASALRVSSVLTCDTVYTGLDKHKRLVLLQLNLLCCMR